MSDFPDREGQYAQREELSRAWAIVDNQTAEIEALEARHAALVAAAQAYLWHADECVVGPDECRERAALRAALASEEEPCGHSRIINSRCDYCGTLVALASEEKR